VKLLKGFALITLALAMSTAGYASRLSDDSSDFGIFKTMNACIAPLSPPQANSCVYVSSVPGGSINGQFFQDTSNNTNWWIFDFLVQGNISNFTLTVNLGNTPLILDSGSNTSGPWAYGAFTGSAVNPCQTNTSPWTTSENMFCGPDPTNALGGITQQNDGQVPAKDGSNNPLFNQVTFNVTGSNGTNGFVFFVVADEDAALNLNLTPNTSAVPEPGSLPMLAAAGIGIALLSRKRLARRLQ